MPDVPFAGAAAVDAPEVMKLAEGDLIVLLVPAAVRAEQDVVRVGGDVAAPGHHAHPRSRTFCETVFALLRMGLQTWKKCAEAMARHLPVGSSRPNRCRTSAMTAARSTATRRGSESTMAFAARICRSRSPSTRRLSSTQVTARATGVSGPISFSGSIARSRSFSRETPCRFASRSAGDSQSRFSSRSRCSTARGGSWSRSST